MLLKRDLLQKFMFESGHVRGQLVHLKESYNAIIKAHDYPLVVKKLLGEALAACCIMAASLKFNGKLSLQLQGKGLINLLFIEINEQHKLRGLAKYDPSISTESFSELVSGGTLMVRIEPEGGVAYQSIVPFEGVDLAACLAHYFRQSEQLLSGFYLFCDGRKASGLMLQQMPDNEDLASRSLFEYAIQLAQTLTQAEAFTLNNDALLFRLFHEEPLRVFEPQEINARCACSKQGFETSLRSLGRVEINRMIEEDGVITINCEFCKIQYQFDAFDSQRIFSGQTYSMGSSDALN